MRHETLDPVTVEVIQNALISFIREMRGTIIRTAFSPIIWEVHDFSCALLAPDGELVALSEDHPIHIVPTMYSIPVVQERFGEKIGPGDIFVLNDPYRLGTHMNDVGHLYPFFVDGRLTFWIVVRVHYTDVGGMAAGSITPDAREIYQEGLRLPPLKVYEQGRPNEAFMDMFFANVRGPEERRGDFMAVMGSFWSGDKRLREILETFGAEQIVRCHEIVRDRAEKRMREAIARLGEGEYAYELNLDSSGSDAGWVPLRVKVTIEHAPQPRLTVDFSESAAGVRGPMNGAFATAACAAFTAVKAFLDPHSPVNGGAFRPIRVVTRPGTILEGRLPMPMGGSVDLGFRVTELVMGALGAVWPANAVGDFSSPAHLYMAGWDPGRGRQYVFYEMPIGGTGAVSDDDGSDVMAGFERGDFARVSSVEVYETQMPYFAVDNELLQDSGGAGKFRGGLGLRRTWRVLGDSSSTVSDLSEPCLTPNYGVNGGYGGAPSTCRVIRDGGELWPGGITGTGKATRFGLQRDDLLQFDKWGGAGYGDPLERAPERVLEDVSEGLVSSHSARSLYGVVIRDSRVDDAATAELRQQLRATRVFVIVAAAGADLVEAGARIWTIHPDLGSRLGAEEDDVLECVTPRTGSLRGRMRLSARQSPDQVAAGPFARQVLRVDPGDTVWIRKVPGVLRPAPR